MIPFSTIIKGLEGKELTGVDYIKVKHFLDNNLDLDGDGLFDISDIGEAVSKVGEALGDLLGF